VKRASLAMVNNLLTSAAAFILLYNNAAETRTVPFAIEQRAIGNTKCRRHRTTMVLDHRRLLCRGLANGTSASETAKWTRAISIRWP
jgi:hypothetical protein